MRIKIRLSSTSRVFSEPMNVMVNGFVQKLLGEFNEYHGKFSRYSVSSLRGGIVVNGSDLSFPNGSYFWISSDDDEFMSRVCGGIRNIASSDIGGMKYVGMDIDDFVLNKSFDLVRCDSLIVKDKDIAYTYSDDKFLDILLEKSKKKLLHCGYDAGLVESLSIELFHPECSKVRIIKIRNVPNICSKVMFLVRGDVRIRRALYENGFGMCTGFGFGGVTLNKVCSC